MAAALIESMGRADVSDLLATLQTSALVVHREQDMIPLADAQAVADAIPGAVRTVFPESGHVPHEEESAAFNARLLEFLEKIP